MVYNIRKLYRPEFYQRMRSSGYFEGWYFKTALEEGAVAFIPGISLSEKDPHAFIQVNRAENPSYHRFETSEFASRRDRFELRLGENRFSLDAIRLRLPGLEVDLRMSNPVRWPSRLFSPSSMGWYSFVRVMECYHAIVVLDGRVEGKINGVEVPRGRFYLEKDWGSSFPRGWIWMQSNSFAAPASLTCSIARVPFRGRSFVGFIVGFYAGGKVHRFTTYNGSRVRCIEVNGNEVSFEVVRAKQTLHVSARRVPGMTLASPVGGEMIGRIQESLAAEIAVRLEENGAVLFEGNGRHGGLEVVNPEQVRPLHRV